MIEVKDKDYEICYEPDNPETLIFLKKPQQLINKFQSKDVLPNFIVLPDAKKSNVHKLSLRAMIQQPVANQLMIKRFCDLARNFYDKKSIQQKQITQFQEIMSINLSILGQNKQTIVLKEYTNSTFFHKFLNSLLRLGTDAMQLFYAHYFVQCLHLIIKEYQQNYHDQSRRNFICYRGAHLSDSQVNNFKNLIGKYIQILGFLSTSLEKHTALNFATNAIFEITVENQDRFQQFDYGYAFLNNVSYSPQQKQILVNALSSFEVLEVSQSTTNGIQMLTIKLKYGSTANIMAKYNKNKKCQLSQKQKQILPMLMYQDSQRVGNQGRVLPMNSEEQIEYFELFLKLANSSQKCSKSKLQYANTFLGCQYLVNNKNQYKRNKLCMSLQIYSHNQKQNMLSQEMLCILRQVQKVDGLEQDKQNLESNIENILERIYYVQSQLKKQQIDLAQNKSQNQLENKNQQKIKKIYEIQISYKICQIILKLQSRNYDIILIKQQFQKLKYNVEQLFGKFHPKYLQCVQFETNFASKLNQSSLQTIQAQQKNLYEIYKQSNPSKLPKYYQLFKIYEIQIISLLQQNQIQQAIIYYIKTKATIMKLIQHQYQYQSNITNYIKNIQSKLLKPLINKCVTLVHQYQYSKCLSLLNKIKINSTFVDESCRKIEQMILFDQHRHQKMYNDKLSQFIIGNNCFGSQFEDGKEQKQKRIAESIMTKHEQIITKIVKIFGEGSDICMKHLTIQKQNKKIIENWNMIFNNQLIF